MASFAAILAWPAACLWPAAPGTDASSLAGWASGLVAILATAEILASGWLYLRASHWFDRHAPCFVGLARRALYRTPFTRGAADGGFLFNPFDMGMKVCACVFAPIFFSCFWS
jgi:hypothetical protein